MICIHEEYPRGKAIRRIPTGSSSLDHLLFGGIETHSLTEIYGPSGVGKTQICYTLSEIAAHVKGKSKVLYIDTENKFRPERILSISKARGSYITDLLNKILYVKAISSNHQELILKKLLMSLDRRKNEFSLIVVDSVINHFRAEFLNSGAHVERQKKLYEYMRLLSALAQKYGIAVVVTNQVNSGFSFTAKPAGGTIMGNTSTYRISLRRLSNGGSEIAAKVVKSSYHPETEACFKLSEKGLEDIEDNMATKC